MALILQGAALKIFFLQCDKFETGRTNYLDVKKVDRIQNNRLSFISFDVQLISSKTVLKFSRILYTARQVSNRYFEVFL